MWSRSERSREPGLKKQKESRSRHSGSLSRGHPAKIERWRGKEASYRLDALLQSPRCVGAREATRWVHEGKSNFLTSVRMSVGIGTLRGRSGRACSLQSPSRRNRLPFQAAIPQSNQVSSEHSPSVSHCLKAAHGVIGHASRLWVLDRLALLTVCYFQDLVASHMVT